MTYDPKSDLTAAKARDVIESFHKLGSKQYGVIEGDDGSIDALIESLPEHAEYDQHDEYDIVVGGHTISAIRA
jgi:hypothetical protein